MKMKKLRSDLSLRLKLRSPGRPPVLHRAERWPFWKALAEGIPARTRRQSLAWHQLSELDGSDYVAVCLHPISHQPPQSPLGGTLPSPSVSRSHWQLPVEKVFWTLPGSSVDRHRLSRGSCGETLQPAPAASNTEPTRRSGMLTAQRCVRSLPNC